MKYIVIDLEMNPVSRKYRQEKRICRSEIIEIGAVLLDEQYKETGSYKTYVRPQFSDRITEEITKLTGISTEDVQDAPVFSDAWKSFYKWCVEVVGEPMQIVTWSDNDQRQVLKEMEMKSYETTSDERSFLDGWHDFQEEYGRVVGLQQCTTMKNAVMLADSDFEGRQHDALADARNTAVLLRTVRIPDQRQNALGKVINVLQAKPLETSLGDLFDFGSLCLA